MKKLIILLLLIGFAGCDEFLEEDVRGIISPNNFYNSDTEAIQAANGLYNTFQSNNLYGQWQGISNFTYFGADVIAPSRVFGGNAAITNYTLTETNYANAYTVWRELFRVVGDANAVIVNVRDNENLSAAVRNQVIGESLFMRAFAYYHLTVLWGDVPFYTDNLALGEVAVLGRTDLKTIRTAMIGDLQRVESENLLPGSHSAPGDLGRLTVWAAKMLRAKYLLWEEDWAGARDACVDIINNSPHRLMDTFDQVFDINNLYNDEVIWGLDYLKDVENTNRTDSFNPRLRDEPKDSGQRNALRNALADRGEEFNGFGLAVPLPAVYENFPDEDLRKPLSCINEYLGFELKFFYMPKLWNLDFVNSPRGNHGEWRVIYRLADAYLMAAEAENELGGPTNAYQYINEVRERAYEPDQPLAALSQDEFRTALIDERKWELAGEDDRRYDLIRWGILVETVQNTVYPRHDANINIQSHHVLLPIPAEEIELNPALLEADPTNNGYR
ncbi:RagB/SusD family nutrient uptake outer membrane protein [Fulvivirgaceae bacterium BMA12]|uniref:RagB/SusD family nutrient uptake outer membrane protein n=1 Tax=Agaribacillus aureus TaxID=3051825 RepID=A0ABT8LKI2_9BACT|nr:RagB/SusD family nutrient uptake outer membrane protein [Fulvivirgaceae bacterium BMA12]